MKSGWTDAISYITQLALIVCATNFFVSSLPLLAQSKEIWANPVRELVEHRKNKADDGKFESPQDNSCAFGEEAKLEKYPVADKYSGALRHYRSLLNSRIKKAWYPPKDGNSVQVRFSIDREGDVSALSLVKNSGLKIGDDAALKAVENALPLPPIPEELPAPLWVVFGFNYNPFGGPFNQTPYSKHNARYTFGASFFLPDDAKMDAKAKSAISGSAEP